MKCFHLSVICIGLVVSLSAIAETPSLTVTIANDVVDPNDGQTSLREALAYAATLDSTNVITFSSTTANGAVDFYDGSTRTITLTSGELDISTSLTIQGPGPNLLTIDGNADDRVFSFSNNITAALSGLTITRGIAGPLIFDSHGNPSWPPDPEYGGGIYHDQGNLTLSNVSVTICSAFSAISARGGGIYNNNGSVTLNNSTISGNDADAEFQGLGGGIFNNNSGTVILVNSTISGSTTEGLDFASGSGVCNFGTLNATNSTISGNSASSQWILGGGIYNSGTMNIFNGLLSGNSASVSGSPALAFGGGIYNESLASINIINSTISGNSVTNSASAAYGGGLYNDDGYAINIVNSTFSGNTAAGTVAACGGGIFNTNVSGTTGVINIINSTFSENVVTASATNGVPGGGGICSMQGPPINVINSTLSGNLATTTATNSSSFGGGIFSSLAKMNVVNSTLSGNSASARGNGAAGAGGGIFNFGLGPFTLTLANSIVAGNISTEGSSPDVSSIDLPLPPYPAGVLSGGYNLIGNTSGSSGWLASDLLNTNPLLGPLQNNGGPTLTMALLPGSPAINAGNNSLAVDQNGNPLATDQRGTGFPRITIGTVDIGAFEFPGTPPGIISADQTTFATSLAGSFTITANGFPTPNLSTSSTLPAWLTLADNGNGTATLAGTPTNGSGGNYFIILVATNGSLPNATQNFMLHVVEKSALTRIATFNTNGLAWAFNGGATVSNNVMTLTDGAGGEARSGWFCYPLYVGAFHASFTYQDVGGGGADGVAFVLQNDPRGTAALGGDGGSLGVGPANPITPSAVLELNVYSGNGQTVGCTFLANGATGAGGANGNYHPPGAVDLAGGHPINITLNYSGSQFALTFTDTVSDASFATNLMVGSLANIVGGQIAYVGFTGADGGVGSTQIITNFSFTSIPTESISVTAGQVIVSWPGAMAGFTLQQNSNLGGTNWMDLTNTATMVNGQNQFALPLTSTNTFYRLKLSSQ